MKRILAAISLLLAVSVSAQDKMLTIENAVFAGRDGLTPKKLAQLGWIKGTESYYYIDKIEGVETLVSASAGSSKAGKIISLTELNEKLRGMQSTAITDAKTFPVITWISPSVFTFKYDKWLLSYNTAKKILTKELGYTFPKEAAGFDKAPVTGYQAYTVGNNLYWAKKTSGNTEIAAWQETAITSDKEINIVNGQSVHRDEFGIFKGTFWSPSGTLLAFYRMDQTMVTDYPILDLTQQPAAAEMIKYPMAGGKSHEVTVGVYNTATGKTIFLKTEGPKDQYLTNIAWSPDNKFVYVAVVNRGQDHLWLNRYNAETGAFDKTLFEETDKEYVHPMHPLIFVPKHDNWFVWQSERDGYNHLYLYDTNGSLVRALNDAKDLYTVMDVHGMDSEGKKIFFTATANLGANREIRSCELATGKQLLLTAADGVHNASFCESFSYFIDDFSNTATPRIQSMYNAKGKQVNVLFTAPDPLAAYRKCDIRLFRISAADAKTMLWCRMILPPAFDSTKKYPSLTYVYNGPNVQLITNSWMGGADFFLYYMAQQGFVVFTVDGRGSGNRGIEFEQATFRKLGTEEIADQEKGNQYLRSKSYIDPARMAVYGWSFGGFMTTSLMTRTPGLYACGVAGGAVIDWSYYEVMYTERYMDTPQENPEGYSQSCLVNYVPNLKGKLLEIHGTSDDVVVWQHTLMYTKACVDKGVQTDYYLYPGHPHNVRGTDRMHLLTKVAEYVKANTR